MSAGPTDPDASDPVPPAVFLERQSYRRRRLMDAARLLPLFGILLFCVPLLWPSAETGGANAGAQAGVPTSGAMIYVFLVWTALIGATVLFGFSARLWTRRNAPPETGQG